MNESLLQEMTKQAERQIALYQTLSIIGFLLGLVSVAALVCIAYGVHRIVAEIASLREDIVRTGRILVGTMDEMREPPSRKATMRAVEKPIADEDVNKWLDGGELPGQR